MDFMDYHRDQEWNHSCRLSNEDITYSYAHLHSHKAHQIVKNPNLQTHLKATTIFLKGLHHSMDGAKKDNVEIKASVERFITIALVKAQMTSMLKVDLNL